VLVDNSFVSFPTDDDLVNYIVARPDQRYSPPLHTEEILLSRFDALKNRFPGSPISTVLIYSWLMPCSGCTKLLIQKFKNCPCKVIVAYNSDWTKAISDEDNQENRNLLRGAGIDVYQIRYKSILPSIHACTTRV
jgi:deoxycytidylate deaminase